MRDSAARLLTEPGFGEAARRLCQEMLSEPAPSEVAAALEGLAAGRSGPRSLAIESEGVPL